MLVNHKDHRGRGDEQEVKLKSIKLADDQQLWGRLGEAEVEIIGAGISMLYSPCPQSAIIIKAW